MPAPSSLAGRSIGIADGVNRGCPGFSGAGSLGWFSDAIGIWVNGTNVGTDPSMVSGSTAGLCIAASSKLAWFTVDGVNFYGASGTARTASDVTAGTDGFNFATAVSASTFYAAVGTIENTGKGYTIQTALPDGWSMPSGYILL
ncbi:hypothetical protein M2171_005239 [Bradyrhizobium japonicum USDA 38]|uniref:hypothetical protein n=1 Tax=Bradyrhizobium japonicum TaxID=375 RepID=UPI0012BB7378|nr:hypothetical protein [Bradyrhizobium japonicum]MCS3896106.1 hypothetical protein [Bradyrhizobium japonicum USDA 38]MCS3948620.1 hypothetical protein [Bradyrhizobium japonicum]